MRVGKNSEKIKPLYTLVMKYTNKILILTLLIIVVFLCACKTADKLQLTKTPFTGNQLRIDGYYCRMYENKCYSVYFFYRDGTLLYEGCGGCDSLKLKEMEQNSFKNEKWINWVKESQISWGVYQIDGQSIKFERWYPSNYWHLPAYIKSGKILNDTTFIITSFERSSRFGTEWSEEKNEMYHFRQFSPKPDSTNRFIK